MLIFLSENMRFLKEQKLEERRLKDRELLLRELEAGGYTRSEYRAKLAKINGDNNPTSGSLSADSTGSLHVRSRADSPPWDIENGVDILEVNEDPVLEDFPRDD